MEALQILLIVVVVSLTLLLFIVGIQVILIVSDLRKAIKKLNTILEDGIWGGGLLRPDKLSGVVEMVKKKKRLISSKKGNVEESSQE